MSQTFAQLINGKSATVEFSTGSASTPSVAFSGDTNTGIYSPGADQVAISTGGSGRLFVDASGRLGIGTSSPGYKLDVVGESNLNGLRIGLNGDTINSTTAGASSVIAFQINGNEKIRLDSSGRLGIGTTSPSATLQVSPSSGSANFQVSRGSKGLQINQDSDSADPNINTIGTTALKFLRDGSESMRIDTSGRLLVGTSSSGSNSTIVLQGSSVSSANESILRMANGSATPASGVDLGAIIFSDNTHTNTAIIEAARDGGTWSGSSKPTRLLFSTTADGASSPTERMRIGSTGSLLCGRDFRDATNGTDDQFIIGGNGYSAFHGLNTTAYTIGQNSNSRALRIGSGSGWATSGVSLAAGGTSWGTYSDERLKTDIVELTGCLESIKGIRCVSYRLTDLDEADSKKRLGVIAQDLVGKYDEAITASQRAPEDEIEYLSVQYTDLIPVLLKALQEATTEIETLKTKVAALESA